MKNIQSFNISINFIFIYSTPCNNYGPCIGVTLKNIYLYNLIRFLCVFSFSFYIYVNF